LKSTVATFNSGIALIPKDIREDVQSSLQKTIVVWGKGASPELRNGVLKALSNRGWVTNVRVSAKLGITVTAMKGKYALSVQTGNMARYYSDVMKQQYLFATKKIVGGLLVVPQAGPSRKMGSNIANFGRVSRELRAFERSVFTYPLLVWGVY